jgi:quercetin dioxygenase-like cupin family protein
VNFLTTRTSRSHAPPPDGVSVVVLRDSAAERLVLLRLAPRASLPLHRTPSAARFVVLEGGGEFTALGVRRRLVAGQQVRFAPRVAHDVCAGDEPLSVVMALTPSPTES